MVQGVGDETLTKSGGGNWTHYHGNWRLCGSSRQGGPQPFLERAPKREVQWRGILLPHSSPTFPVSTYSSSNRKTCNKEIQKRLVESQLYPVFQMGKLKTCWALERSKDRNQQMVNGDLNPQLSKCSNCTLNNVTSPMRAWLSAWGDVSAQVEQEGGMDW